MLKYDLTCVETFFWQNYTFAMFWIICSNISYRLISSLLIQDHAILNILFLSVFRMYVCIYHITIFQCTESHIKYVLYIISSINRQDDLQTKKKCSFIVSTIVQNDQSIYYTYCKTFYLYATKLIIKKFLHSMYLLITYIKHIYKFCLIHKS